MGYVLRLSEENGYATPWHLYLLACMKQNEIRTSGFKLEKLAAITFRPTTELAQIRFSAPIDKPRWACLLGHNLVPTEMNVTDTKFCPQCVAEKGFIEAHWHLSLMAACPIHLRLAALKCPKCNGGVRWFRPGLLECGCGGDLLYSDRPPISATEASLLEVIKRKTLSDLTDQENPLALPLRQLMAMNLRSMLSLIRVIGKYRLIASGRATVNDQMQTIVAAAEVLKHWPANFIKLLKDLGAELPNDTHGGVGKQFEGIYRALFKNKAVKPREQVDFIKAAFVDFAVNHWGRGFVDRKLLGPVKGDEPSRFLTQTDFAATLGVQQRTAARLLKNHTFPSTRVKCGKVERIVVDANQQFTPRNCSGRILRDRAAAKLLGLSVPVLKALKRTGEFKVEHLLPTRPGFHSLDVDAFRQRLLSIVPTAERSSTQYREWIALGAIMRGRHDSPEIKASVVVALLSGELDVVYNVERSVDGLLLEWRKYQRFISDARCRAAGNAITSREVAEELLCDAGAVPGLLRLGYLRGSETALGLRITEESVTEFKRQFTSLAAIARREATRSRALMRRCEERDIKMLLVAIGSSRGAQPFIRTEDRQMLLVHEERTVRRSSAEKET
jgi:hypothetical protein